MRILIIGAGIVGMPLAALLDRHGVKPTLVDRVSLGTSVSTWPVNTIISPEIIDEHL